MKELIKRMKDLQLNKVKRNYSCEIRAEDTESGNIITGRPIVYDSPTDMGWYREIIDAGALNDADMTDVAFLANHDTRMIPLARSRNNTPSSTMQLIASAMGLDVNVRLDCEKNSVSRALHSAVMRGDISGMSFMFTIRDYEWIDADSDYPTLHIKSIAKVYEVSAVTWPAYEATEIDARNKDTTPEGVRRSLDSERDRKIELERMKNRNILLSVTGGKTNE